MLNNWRPVHLDKVQLGSDRFYCGDGSRKGDDKDFDHVDRIRLR